MLQPIESTKDKNYFKLPPFTLGIQQAPWRPGHRIWGRRPTIEFLINLGWWWDFSWNPYDQIVQSNICLGDISPEGGASKRDPVKDHKTHNNGHAVDIFYIRKDGKPEKTSILQQHKDSYDFEQNLRLAKMIVHTANRLGLIIGFAHCNDKKIQAEVPNFTTFVGHDDHFHVFIVHPSEAPKNHRR